MTSKPLVSAITIFREAERFLDEAIQSVFAQTYEAWELLLVDDGSTDTSTETARRYARRHPAQVRYLQHEGHENRGMSASRNLGITHAQGKYVAFLDADDVWLPPKLEQQVAILETNHDAEMVYGRTEIWYSWTGEPRDNRRDRTLPLGVPVDTLVYPPTLFLLLLKNKVQSPTTCNAIMRRRVFDIVGGFEEVFRGMYEDQVFFAKLHLKAPVYVAGSCWARYRQHADSHSAACERVGQYHEIRLPFLNWLDNHLREEGFAANSPESRALRRAMWPYRHPTLSRCVEHLQSPGSRAFELVRRLIGSRQ